MRTPFVYPQKIHKRTKTPRLYSDYRKYKSPLSEEFGNKCVYCRIPDGLKDKASFGVDHYRPKKKYPALKADYSNLYYCCNTCNSRKGDFWPSTSQLMRGIFIANPCDHVMSDYLRYYGNKVRTKNHSGEFMAEHLDLNDLERVEYRADILTLIKKVLPEYTKVRNTVRALDKKSRAEKNAPTKATYEHEKNKHAQNLNKIRKVLFRLTADKQFTK